MVGETSRSILTSRVSIPDVKIDLAGPTHRCGQIELR